jgi:hypothetical protein
LARTEVIDMKRLTTIVNFRSFFSGVDVGEVARQNTVPN